MLGAGEKNLVLGSNPGPYTDKTYALSKWAAMPAQHQKYIEKRSDETVLFESQTQINILII